MKRRMESRRSKRRGREGDPKTFEAFVQIEKVEEQSKDQTKQQMLETFKMADRTIVNDSDLQSFYSRIEALLLELGDLVLQRLDALGSCQELVKADDLGDDLVAHGDHASRILAARAARSSAMASSVHLGLAVYAHHWSRGAWVSSVHLRSPLITSALTPKLLFPP